MRKLAMIGVGNMGEALARGILRARVVAPEALVLCDARAEVAARVADELGVAHAGLEAAVAGAEVVVLAVKPQGMAALLEALALAGMKHGVVVLSVAAGWTLAQLEAGLPAGAEVVRAMPNTPALIGLGASAFALGGVRTGAGDGVARAVLGAVGVVLEVPESAMDAVTALSGSGPAYVFRMLEALTAAGERVGLAPEVSEVLARQTLLGAATLAGSGEVAPAELRRRVTSPGGTTEAALRVLEGRGWAATLGDAIEAARARGAELGAGLARRDAGALARVAEARARGEQALAILDVDLTLIENAPRTRAVLQAWVASLSEIDEGVRGEAAARVAELPLVFSIRANLATVSALLGHEGDAELAARGFAFWKQAFFEPANLVHDEAMPGAVEAVQRLVGAGATVVYLTARGRAMAAATTERLGALGFPVAQAGAVLVTKDDARESDEAFKVRVLGWCRQLGRVVLQAENEPSHANQMQRAFPDALTLLVGTRHSTPAPEPAAGVVRVERLIDAL